MNKVHKVELLSPAGDVEKLKTALYFGADAVYIGGKRFSLRASAGNFTDEEIEEATAFAHGKGKKVYVTVNIFANNDDICEAEKFFKFLEKIGVDGAIISDPGLVYVARQTAPNLKINLSTQANTLNYKAVEFWKNQGVKRVILARELPLKDIAEIKRKVPDIEIETFVHGAMCISYSGRCLLSDYRAGRKSNRGECVQACRWNYEIRERGSDGEFMQIEEDGRGTYILNSKDLNLIDRLDDLISAGVCSFKIEGRMKSEYYLATVVNAYRRAIDGYYKEGSDYKKNDLYREELKKTAHRDFTVGFFDGENGKTVNYNDSQSKGSMKFVAVAVEDAKDGKVAVEMRNRFKKGDVLEVLSPNETFNKTIEIGEMRTENGEIIDDAKVVQQKIFIVTDVPIKKGDVLRTKN